MRQSRREFLATGGALVVSFTLAPLPALAQEGGHAAPTGPKLPGSLTRNPMLDAWIRIDANGAITVFTGKVELGQGVKTALQQVAAEELVVPFERITMVTADTERTPNEGITSGSNSMKDSGTAILNAAAQVRAILVDEAARRLGVPAAQLTARDGAVHASGRSITYGDLVAGGNLHVNAAAESKLLDPSRRVVMGRALARLDIPAKVTGGVAYVHDLRLDGMVHARTVRPAGPGARLRSLDAGAVERMPGVIKIVRDGNYVAVVAAREFQAIRAARALGDRTAWEPAALPQDASIHAHLLGLPARDSVILDRGSPDAGTFAATYRRPYQLHGAIGPSCAVAQMRDGKLTVWTHSQGVYPLRDALAEMVRMPREKVHCVHMEGSGCYGHNGADDVAADAALCALALPGRPVRVQWTREEEHAWEPFGPAMESRVRASLEASGRIGSWRYDVWSNTHSTRPGKAGNLLPAMLLATPFIPEPPRAIPQPEGGGDRNAIPLYVIPNARVVSHFIASSPLRTSALRSLGAYLNVFAIESSMDELAAAARADPVEFRLRHLEDPRAIAVVKAAAERFGWTSFERRRGHGRGFAFARYKNLAAYCAIAMEARVDPETGDVRIGRVAAAVDSGEAVNPDGIRNQIEGGIVQSISWTLFEAVTWEPQRITSRDWARYPIARFSHVPESVDVHVISHPGSPFLGTGEASQGPAAAAVANAVADAIGGRIRDIPLTPGRVHAAAGASAAA